MNPLGKRITCDGFVGTIRYVGQVPPNSGDWLGIEWDDPSRGKHDGTHEGVKYFNCRYDPRAASFVRPKKVQYGCTVPEAICERYGPPPPPPPSSSGDGVADVMGVYEDSRFLARLEEVGLCRLGVAECGDEIAASIPSVTSLDLSDNLISSWSTVAGVASQLADRLTTLQLSGNCIESFDSVRDSTFPGVKVLFLNRMKLEWNEVVAILRMFPLAEEVHVCWNAITTIDASEWHALANLRLLNLEKNSLRDWAQIMKLSCLSRLETLIVSGNFLESISFSGDDDSVHFPTLKSLSLNDNKIAEWDSVNSLSKLKTLRELKFKGNPCLRGEQEEDARFLLIARLPNVQRLNGSPVSAKERQLAERYYIKRFAKDRIRLANPAEFCRLHPRYDSLIKEHGEPIASQTEPPTGVLKDTLLCLTLECPEDLTKKTFTKKLPSTMTLLKLKAFLGRLYRINATEQIVSYRDQKLGREYELKEDQRTLSFYSIQSGDTILLRW
ncbi:tubulin-specific chaperone E-like isoform X2 [Oscarella lobularis]|uniref:tubulin-specific chaperone E-like isoform X2 n=1 Tax=Oscarella lobularis TaxID=121494 RepID=UPI00331334A1